MKVLVLCGGESAERIVSLASGDAVAGWIAEAGHVALKYDPEVPGKITSSEKPLAPVEIGLEAPLPRHSNGYDPRLAQGLLDVLGSERPEIIFPILHGGRGEDGTLQALLDWVGIPYTGSGVLASALAMNKEKARHVFRAAGVPIVDGFVVGRDSLPDVDRVEEEIRGRLGFPVVVKPIHGGSTVGLTKVDAPRDLHRALEAVGTQHDDALIESHFAGRELTVTVVADEAYPVIEIRPHQGFYDYANKYTSGRTDYLCPAPISESLTKHLQQMALKAFRALDCAGFARVDFLANERDDFVCLEVNTLPGMTQRSLVPKAARARGEEPPRLMSKILECGMKRAARL